MKTKILIVEDEKNIVRFLKTILEADGYQIISAQSGQEGISMAALHTPDLMILDLGLPDMEGKNVLHGIRQWTDLPVIVVSARQDESEKVALLDAGANDYVTKPFGNSELLARIRTSLRLSAAKKDTMNRLTSRFCTGELTIDYARRVVRMAKELVHLTPTEYRILVLLAQNAGRVLTHDHIIREVWGPFGGDSQVLRVNMANIRRKVEPDPADPRYILTEIGVGYRLVDSAELPI